MKKIFIFFIAIFANLVMLAQQPLVLSKVITKDGMTAQQIFDLAKNWSSKEFAAGTLNTNSESEILELSGKGRVDFHTSMLYSSIQGAIDFLIDIQCKEGRLKITMRDFTHKASHYAAFNNNMGMLLEELPKDLSTIGVTGANRKACYKYFFKHGKELVQTKFENICTSLESFLTKRDNDNQNW